MKKDVVKMRERTKLVPVLCFFVACFLLVFFVHKPLTVQPILTAEKRDQLHTLLHHCPRTDGKNRSPWTLHLRPQVACEQGLSEQTLSVPTLLDAIGQLGVSWKRAKHWITSPDPAYTRKTVVIG